MRIALVHSFYASQAPSGENVVVLQEAAALGRAGHEVHLVRADTDRAVQEERFYRSRAGLRVASGYGRSPLAELVELAPDVVHVHNLFPNYGSRWMARSPAPVVATLHNFRALCAPGTLHRDGHDCRLCLDGHPWAGTRHGCYRESRLQTLPLSLANRRGLPGQPVFRHARRLITMTEQARDMYVASGADPARMVVKPHFLSADVTPSAAFAAAATHSGPWLFAGNLLPHKGVLDLVRRWPGGHRLLVVGDGPLRRDVERAASADVEVVGALPRQDVLGLMAEARGLVFPSKWLETFGMVYAEALACGLPVLAFEGNVVADQVSRYCTGGVLRWSDDLGRALSAAAEAFPPLHAHCRRHFEQHFTEASHLEAVEAIYFDAVREAGTPAAGAGRRPVRRPAPSRG